MHLTKTERFIRDNPNMTWEQIGKACNRTPGQASRACDRLFKKERDEIDRLAKQAKDRAITRHSVTLAANFMNVPQG